MPTLTARSAICALLLAGCFVDAGNRASGPKPQPETDTGDPGGDTSSGVDTGDAPTTGSTGEDPPGGCGDAIQGPDEECDLGAENNGVDGSFCRADCTTNLCGDGYLAGDETCDDGNLTPGDGCNASCQLEVCGDGAPAPNELCDDGNLADDDACTSQCVPAACGDGIMQTGVEACDDGNLDDGDGCTASCTVEACGNGVVDPGEECDDGDAEDGDGCSVFCQRDAYFVFVTSERYIANFGGITQADTRCAERAAAAGLPGVYLAWLSAGNQTPLTRLVQSPLPFVLRDGTQIALNWADLTDGDLLHAIDQTESGQIMAMPGNCNAEVSVWTGTKANGGSAGTDLQCLGWSLGLGNGRTGDATATGGGWTNSCNISCQTPLRLYCFEQGT